MNKPFEIEFWIGLEAIDNKGFDTMPHVPSVGEYIFLTTENNNYNLEHGEYFRVTQTVPMFFSGKPNKQKVCVWLKPVSKEEVERSCGLRS